MNIEHFYIANGQLSLFFDTGFYDAFFPCLMQRNLSRLNLSPFTFRHLVRIALLSLRVLYGVLGLVFLDTVDLLAGHPAARGYYLFSFLLDYDDVMQDYTA